MKMVYAASQGTSEPYLSSSDQDLADTPWWDNFPLIVQGGAWGDDAPAIGQRFSADAVFCASADDPGWGIYGQRIRMIDFKPEGAAKMRAAGLRSMGYFETFGTGFTYIAQLKKNPDGSWVKYASYPDVTRIFLQHWGWQSYDRTGEIHWIGAHNYFDDEDFARPYTRTHPRYGSPPMTYPDGTVASGYNGPATDPRNSRVYDAGCSKDVLGNVFFEYDYNNTVNQNGGPFDGLIKMGAKYSGLIFPPKDSACPFWIDYARASTLQALDAGLDGMWTDNFSPWDSFNYWAITKAFGDWSVAGFRGYLARQFSPVDLAAMGVANASTFDVRVYLQNKLSALGGTPTDLNDWRWQDARWLDDPVWRAYKIYKRQTGTTALSNLYQTVKNVAAAAGKPDFLVAGNDFNHFNLGWARGNLDMVSTELSWGWGLEMGERGLMPPPIGSYVPTYKQAREQARSRFVNVWMYVPTDQANKPGIANVLFYQGLANHTLPMPQAGKNVTAGDDATNAAFFAFVRSIRPTLGARPPVEEIGIYHSTSSQLAFLTPNGTPISTFNAQPHSFAYLGWGTALGELQYQYRSVPEWKLTPATLAGLRVFIIPNAEVFDLDDIAILEPWIRAGGLLIVTGDSGLRRGEAHNFDRNVGGLSLASLTGVSDFSTAPVQQVRRIGNGAVLYLKDNIGMEFYNAVETRPTLLAKFVNAINAVTSGQTRFVLSNVGSVPTTVGLTVYDDSTTQRRFVDVNNVNINLNTDTITPSPAITFTLDLPTWLREKPLTARVLSPDISPTVTVIPNGTDRVDVRLSSVRLYASVVLELARPVANVSAASYSGSALVSKAIVAAFGSSLATTTQAATAIPLPTSLAGTQVLVKDSTGTERLAPLFFVSPLQVNYQIPAGTMTGAATVTITDGNGIVSTGTMQVVATGPALFTFNQSGSGAAIAQDAFTFAGPPFAATRAGGEPNIIVLYGTGLGADATDIAGDVSASVQVIIDSSPVTVLYAGQAPGLVGLNQFNVMLSVGITSGTHTLIVARNGVQSNTVTIAIK